MSHNQNQESIRDSSTSGLGFWSYEATIWNEGKRCVIVVPLRILTDIENQGKRTFTFRVTLTPIREAAKSKKDSETDEPATVSEQ